MARCGIINAGNNADQWRNYDFPKNALGDAMKSNPQMNYVEGSIIDVEVILTAHHKGHFTFKACAISSTSEAPTQECFDRNPLTFVSDKLYGANVDTNYPERVYVAPDTTVTIVPSLHGFTNCMIFQYRLQLPEGLFGELVLIQWYYVAANSACVHAGYDTYDWPAHWITNTTGNGTAASAWDEKVSVGTGLKLCDEVLPEDGDGKYCASRMNATGTKGTTTDFESSSSFVILTNTFTSSCARIYYRLTGTVSERIVLLNRSCSPSSHRKNTCSFFLKLIS